MLPRPTHARTLGTPPDSCTGEGCIVPTHLPAPPLDLTPASTQGRTAPPPNMYLSPALEREALAFGLALMSLSASGVASVGMMIRAEHQCPEDSAEAAPPPAPAPTEPLWNRADRAQRVVAPLELDGTTGAGTFRRVEHSSSDNSMSTQGE